MTGGTVKAISDLIDAINIHDPAAVARMLSDDHRFIDARGITITGGPQMAEAWKAFFLIVPDYRIDVTRFFPDGQEVMLHGIASGTPHVDNRPTQPHARRSHGAWRATADSGLVSLWQVFADTSERQAETAEFAWTVR